MFGRGRRAGIATVVERRFDPGSTWSARLTGFATYDYVLDVTPESDDDPFRAQARAMFRVTPEYAAPDVGDAARVTFDERHEDVKFDIGALKDAAAAAQDERDARFDAIAAQPPGTGRPAPTRAPLDPELQELMDREERERNAP